MGARSRAETRLPHLSLELTYQVHTAASVAARIRSLAESSSDGRETGGILLGHGPSPAGLISLRHAGDPGPAAERRRDLFSRDLEHSRRFAARAWQLDGSEWAGEWHTHPGGGAAPSALDLRTYARILASTPAFEAFVAIIVTPGGSTWASACLNTWIIGPEPTNRRKTALHVR
jgi:integrative and conjugative element protein (TIGR02256 family)